MPFHEPREPRVLVVDDDPDLCTNLVKWLRASGYAASAAPDGTSAMAMVRSERPDVVVSDLQMMGMNGLDLLRLLKEFDPRIQVIIITGYPSIETAIEALRQGRAFDYLQKPLMDMRQLNLAIERALNQVASAPIPKPVAHRPELNRLSPRERELLELLGRGMDVKEISQVACLAERTVRNYLSSIYDKLHVSNRTQAVMVYLNGSSS